MKRAKAVMKRVAKKKKMKKWKKLSSEEIRLAQKSFREKNMTPKKIADLLDRNKSTLTRLLVKQLPRKKQGKKRLLSEADVDRLERRLHEMILAAKCRYHVTATMLKKDTKTKASPKTIQKAFRKRNIYFRNLREKPLLTPEDMKDRLDFSKKHKDKPASWWRRRAYIDCKHFKTYLTSQTRQIAAMHRTYGAYRKPGQGLCGGYVKPKKTLNFNTGSKSSLIAGAVGAGKLLMWYDVPKGQWSGQAAADMYTNSLKPALLKKWPVDQSYHEILEDNDPTGFKSKKGIAAKSEAKLRVFAIPKRSPDLSVMDYAVWPEINKRMRRQEKRWSSTKRETRAQYLARLKRTAMRLPASFVDRSIEDMRRRCQRCFDADGGYFEEGGRRGC